MHEELAELKRELLRLRRHFVQPRLFHVQRHAVFAKEAIKYSAYARDFRRFVTLASKRNLFSKRNPFSTLGKRLERRGWRLSATGTRGFTSFYTLSKGPVDVNFFVHPPFIIHFSVSTTHDIDFAEASIKLEKLAVSGHEGETIRPVAALKATQQLRKVEELEKRQRRVGAVIEKFQRELRRGLGIRKMRQKR